MNDKPCAECPFRRDIEPGFLGGSPVETYLGQILLPFWLPCHRSRNYAGKASQFDEVDQCRGAAILRANIGVADLMPDELIKLPPDTRRVFPTLAAFYAHHRGDCTVERAAEFLSPAVLHCYKMKEWCDANTHAVIR